jgi:hypothetical protein
MGVAVVAREDGYRAFLTRGTGDFNRDREPKMLGCIEVGGAARSDVVVIPAAFGYNPSRSSPLIA